MGHSYEDWVANAPESYTSDGFFTGRRPVAITSRYGQNQPIGQSDDDHEIEDRNWEEARRWGEISHVTIAVATHIQ
jgi:hypothetical protein